LTNPTLIEVIAAGIFAIALIHTFSTKFFEHLAHVNPAHKGVWHLLGEVEVVFGFWALVLVLVIFGIEGQKPAVEYLESRTFVEPFFVFAIMVVAASKPILQLAMDTVSTLARLMPARNGITLYFTTLFFVPLLGSFITEPAAMTLAALILREQYYAQGISNRLKYATLGVLFVNISIGGTLTPFAAPPVLMVAAKWGWDLPFMLSNFGWKAALAVLINAGAATLLFRHELGRIKKSSTSLFSGVPKAVVAVHVLFLVGIVTFAHHPAVFIGLLLFFIGFVSAYERYQNPLILREGLLVAFFLAGLVVLGGQQQWWLEPLLGGLDNNSLFFGAIALTAITDNAALTYLGSLVEGVSDGFKYALVAGAVTGGGLTVIANAPNPAGYSLLKGGFDEGAINPLGLLAAALPPTLVAVIAFWFL
jgi:hypothetical protein